MTRRNTIIYWVATAWLSLGMLSTGIVQLIHMKEEVARMQQLGYPSYLLTLLGLWKILGVAVVLMPRWPLLKEWAYAGFVFTMTGAIFSHLANHDDMSTLFGPTLLLVLSGVSWYFRPASRRLVIKTH